MEQFEPEKAAVKKPGPAPEAERYSREAAAARKAGDFAKALALSEKAAELGHAAAQFNCGVMNYHGKGTAVDKAKAKSFFQKAAAQTEDPEVQERAKEILREYF